MKIIDAHQHFWDPSRGDYSWMPLDNKILNRKYDLEDLTKDSKSIELYKTVLVQAAATNAETEYISWFNTAQNLTNNLSLDQKQNIFYENAIKFYKLKI